MPDACTLIGLAVAGLLVVGFIVLVNRALRASDQLHRFEHCPRCDRPVRRDERFCPDCHLDLQGVLADRLDRVQIARSEIRHLRELGELDDETAGRALDGLHTRRERLLERPARRATPPPLPPRDLPVPPAVPTLHPVVAPEAPAEVGPPPVPPPPRRSLAEVFGRFMHERNILWGELAGGLLIVGCSIALVLSLWRTLEVLPYFPVLLFAGITGAVFGAGQYTLHHWKLTGTSRGLLVIALLLTPLNVLLLADPGRGAASDAVDVAVKAAGVLLFVGLVRTAGRDLTGRGWLLTLAVVGAPAVQVVPWPAAAFGIGLPAACWVVAATRLTWRQVSEPRRPIDERTGVSLLLFVGLGLFAVFAAWGFVLTRAGDLAATLQSIAPAAVVAVVPVLSVGLLVQRRVREPVGLKVAGTGVALSAVVVMVAGLFLAWPDPGTLLAVSAIAGGVLTWAAHRDRLPWLMTAAVPFLALAALLTFHGSVGAWPVPVDREAGEWLGERLTSAAGGAVLVGFALGLLAGSEAVARFGRHRQALADALGAAAVAAVGLFVVSIRGLDHPAVAAGAHVAAAAGFLWASGRWPFRVVAQVGAWLLLPATLWALQAIAPGRLAVWGSVIAAEGLVLALTGFVGGRRGAAARDVAGATVLLALGLGLGHAHQPAQLAHTGTLAAVTATLFVLARHYRRSEFTWLGSVVGLLVLVHLIGYPLDVRPWTAVVLTSVLAHATATTIAAYLVRPALYAQPLRECARIAPGLAMLLLFVPAVGLGLTWAGLAAWAGSLWLAMALLWRERFAFALFQGTLTWAAVLVGVAWVARQDGVGYFEPRALFAYGVAVAALSVAWVVAARALRDVPRVRELWDEVRPSVDRLVLGGLVVAFACLALAQVAGGVNAELTPHFGVPATPAPVAWVCLGVLALAVGLNLRWAWRTDWPLAGLLALALTGAVLGAVEYGPELAAASALRWGLGTVFVLASAVVALREPVARCAAALGFPTNLTRPGLVGLYALLAVAATMVVAVSGAVADLGLSGRVPAGPGAGTIFARLGWVAANVVPLALVVAGLTVTALRERWAGYAFAAGLVLTATVAGGYALGIMTGGGAIDQVEKMRLGLLAAGSAAVWALGWLAVERRVPDRGLLTIQSWLGLLGLTPLALVPVFWLVFRPDHVLGSPSQVLGVWGWAVLGPAALAAVWRAERDGPTARWHVAGWTLGLAGVLAAAVVGPWDRPDAWLSFHVLAIAWAAGGLATALGPVRVWPQAFAAGLVVLALRAGWADPWRPWLSLAVLLVAALSIGLVAVRTRSAVRAYVSGGICVLAVWLVWVGVEADSLSSLGLALGIGFALAAAAWALSRVEPASPAVHPFSHFGATLGLALVALALQEKFAGLSADPRGLNWAAIGAAAVACGALLRDRRAVLAAGGLYVVGALATVLLVTEVRSESVWRDEVTPFALAGYGLVAALALRRRAAPVFVVPFQAALALLVLVLAVRTAVAEPTVSARLFGPVSAGLLAVTAGLMAPRLGWLRPATLVLATAAVGLVGWALPDPAGAAPWLNRQAWLFAAVTGSALVCTGLLPRLRDPDWVRDARRTGAVLGVLAVVAYLANLCQQIPLFDPAVKRTPLDPLAVWAGIASLLALTAVALRYALRTDRDPLGPTPHGRAGYVYLAEALLVLVFVQVRLNVPQAFNPKMVGYWTFIVMGVAFVGVGLAELFARRGAVVLARPLTRTGVLVPLIPLLAFWAKLPESVFRFARDQAPGLEPLFGYLKNLPQHFDAYALLWFLAGLLYGLVALSRRSFGWALIGALAANFGVWSLLTHHQVPAAIHPQAWAIPVALIILVSEHVHRGRLRADVSAGLRYLGISLIYVASSADLFIAGVGESVWLPVVLAALCLAGVVAGVLLRVRAFLYLGIGFLLLDVFAMVWYAAVDRAQTWVWYASGIVLGAIILAVFAVVEKRRADVAGLVSRLREWD
ncbi:MAG TPA: zinc ribbon domain-containing protein [Gemmataceae bacterium]|nr:zinc ribbon domain-containing protein [Gemmataceae bacterium]